MFSSFSMDFLLYTALSALLHLSNNVYFVERARCSANSTSAVRTRHCRKTLLPDGCFGYEEKSPCIKHHPVLDVGADNMHIQAVSHTLPIKYIDSLSKDTELISSKLGN